MSDKLVKKQTVNSKGLLMSEVIQSETLINLFDKKGLISKQELLEEMKRVQTLMKSSQ